MKEEQIPVYRTVHQDQLRRGVADLSGSIMHTPITEELLVETSEEANVARGTARRFRRAMEELRWMEAAFQVYQGNLLENWGMVQAEHDGSVLSFNSEEPERSDLCILAKGLDTNPHLTATRLFRGKVQHTSNHSRGDGHRGKRHCYWSRSRGPQVLNVFCLWLLLAEVEMRTYWRRRAPPLSPPDRSSYNCKLQGGIPRTLSPATTTVHQLGALS